MVEAVVVHQTPQVQVRLLELEQVVKGLMEEIHLSILITQVEMAAVAVVVLVLLVLMGLMNLMAVVLAVVATEYLMT
jgi:hypothetical protein